MRGCRNLDAKNDVGPWPDVLHNPCRNDKPLSGDYCYSTEVCTLGSSFEHWEFPCGSPALSLFKTNTKHLRFLQNIPTSSTVSYSRYCQA